jgi:hypothetical protein
MIFFIFFLMTIDPAHHIYNIQLTEFFFNEIYLFQNSPVQPLVRPHLSSSPFAVIAAAPSSPGGPIYAYLFVAVGT